MQIFLETARGLVAEPLAAAKARLAARRPLVLGGLSGSSKAWIAVMLAEPAPGARPQEEPRPLVVAAESFEKAEALWADARFFGGAQGIYFFPPWDTMPYDTFSPQKELAAQRFETLDALAQGRARLVITTVSAMMQATLPLDRFQALVLRLERGKTYPRAALVEGLAAAGYNRVEVVEAPGEFGVRGEIVDVFPIQEDHPVRLDFFGDALEELRPFRVDDQASMGELERLTVYPAGEGVMTRETARHALTRLPHYRSRVQPDTYRQLAGFFERAQPFPGMEQLLPLLYPQVGWLHQALPPRTVLVWDEPERLAERAGHVHDEVLQEYRVALEQGTPAPEPDEMYLSPAHWKKEYDRFQRVEFHGLLVEDGQALGFAGNQALRPALAGQPEGAHGVVGSVIEAVRGWQKAGAGVFMAARSQTGAERLRQLLAGFQLGAWVAPWEDQGALLPAQAAPGAAQDVVVLPRSPQEGFRIVDGEGNTRFALLTEEELLGEKTRQRRVKKTNIQQFLSSLGDIRAGDPVVHVEYGVGRYQGMKRMKAGRVEGDFLELTFAGDDKVYVPVYNFHQVQKFTGVEGAQPPLSRLGDGAWAKTKAKAARQVKDMAEELVRLYALRAARQGFAFPPHEAQMTEFAEAFPYQETEDQEKAIADVLADMTREQPMDRLVCGDVGFGKTEVAMRAAWLACLGGKQVMVLVPTTILAQQHYETFQRRFAGFPVSSGILSRFRSPKEQKDTLKQFAEGKLDILIGTHRLLSKDVAAKDLGLLVVDEEQRFGVAHKERVKQIKTQVDVLTLSATPIPRTLHMSLMGVRDLSLINTPPMDRMAVRTRLFKSSDYVIQEAVNRELRRGGQVFFVHNRVETIHAYGQYLLSILPNARVGVAHGQMAEHQLEEVMLKFIEGDLDVLLSTSIIESGLDIPRANTIIINNADFFGLSQLYQMRGRVGRSNQQAYAYLLVSPEKLLTEVAQKRLTLLQELNDLGSGFKIASHDLEIRGAGNLLGAEQSGFINSVGLELYTRMVEEAVAVLKGEEAALTPTREFKMDLGFPYLIPEGFIEGTQQRLEVYKQMAEVTGEEELWALRQNLEDRFGRVPGELDNLLNLIRARILAQRLGVFALERKGDDLQARFAEGAHLDVDKLMALVADPARGLRLFPDGRLLLGAMPPSPQAVLERLKVLEPLGEG
ncbi:MAG: transcription-repair coupling factor [Deltaproteobacteria bacterium]|nr:transcription-repair coupling factor [Deltaproteobacteria bacterium]